MKKSFEINIKVMVENKEIVLTRDTARAAATVGSDAYNRLKEVKELYPNYEIVVRHSNSLSKRKGSTGITKEFVAKCVREDTNDARKAEYAELIKSDAKFLSIMRWFLKAYPEHDPEEKKKRIAAIVANAAAN
jgi:hypothetical protein